MTDRWVWALLGIGIAVVYLLGLWVPVMNVDAAQYAVISAEMLHSGSYLQVTCRGLNYLDKPPLLFWLNTVAFRLFGISTASYKFFSLLSVGVAVFSVYRLAADLYDRRTALRAALLLATCQAFFLFANDVRTDALLTGMVTLAVWLLFRYGEHKKMVYLIAGSAAVGLAMLAKGPIGLVVPAAALGSHWLLQRRWQMFLHWPWLVGAAVIVVLLAPMTYGLYRQFGMEGVRFFFWTQSFGRITGESPWRNDAGFFYFWGELLWAYLPWTFWVLAALMAQVNELLRHRLARNALPEAISLGGFLLPFIALSFSQFKLSHYVFVVFPLAAVFTAAGSVRMERSPRLWRLMLALQALVLLCMLIGTGILNLTYFPVQRTVLWLPVLLFLAAATVIALRMRKVPEWIFYSAALVAVAVNFLMNTNVYPQLVRYQAGLPIAERLKERNWDTLNLSYLDYHDYALEFYLGRSLPWYDRATLDSLLAEGRPMVVIGRDSARALLQRAGSRVQSVDTLFNHSVTRLSLDFLNPRTRSQTLEPVYMIRF
ncbi:MAG: glycosyltransferase family 39 protein [Chitinophagales bacterium]|nr:glycosyltransferase family 39 protein [Chitinophagales bacterium]